MIRKLPFWTYSFSGQRNYLDEKTTGKWFYTAPMAEIKIIFQKVDELVEQGIITSAKYTNKNMPDDDPFFDLDPVMCVYADDDTKESVLEHLVMIGVEPEGWKYDWETRRDWAPGGKLYEKLQKFKESKLNGE